jgi:hypothetical protein
LETDQDGRKKDPWSRVSLLGLIREHDGEPIVYVGSSYGGRKAVGLLLADAARKPEGLLPVITLSSTHYRHKLHGKVCEPVLRAIRWVDADGKPVSALPSKKPRLVDALDDDIPF